MEVRLHKQNKAKKKDRGSERERSKILLYYRYNKNQLKSYKQTLYGEEG